MDNITKIADIGKYLHSIVQTPCCGTPFKLRDCVNNLMRCDCGDVLR
jgi:hypothetical protein